MTKFLLPVIALAAVVMPAPQAEAGGDGGEYRPEYLYEERYERYERPFVEYREYRVYRPAPRIVYRRPVRIYHNHGYCAPSPRVYVSRPRVRVSFGF